MDCIKIVQNRIKYLKELLELLPLKKTFQTSSRLTEAEHILELLENAKKGL